jgi:hypothetical protein
MKWRLTSLLETEAALSRTSMREHPAPEDWSRVFGLKRRLFPRCVEAVIVLPSPKLPEPSRGLFARRVYTLAVDIGP